MRSYLYNAVNQEIDFQEKLMKRLERRQQELEEIPSYTLVANKRKGRKQYYIQKTVEGVTKRQYLGKKQDVLRKNLQEKFYLKRAIYNCNANLEMLHYLKDNYYPVDPIEVVSDAPYAYQEQEQANHLLYGYKSDDRWVKRKLAIKAKYKTHNNDGLKHIAIDGTITRSKSEALIINLLIEKGVTFVYEFPMKFGGKLKSPDFLIYDRKSNREIIIEHLGRMDSESYREDQYDKLGLYINNGYVPNVNLLLTFDDANGNINIPAISNMIDAILNQS